MKNIFFTLLVVFNALFFLIGCGTTNPVHQTTKKNPNDTNPIPELQRVFMDGGLEKNVEVVSINQGIANEDLLRIQVNLKNLTKKSMNLNYKVEWMDQDGIVLNDSSATWLPLYVRGAEIVAVQSVATSPSAKNFWLKLQRAKR